MKYYNSLLLVLFMVLLAPVASAEELSAAKTDTLSKQEAVQAAIDRFVSSPALKNASVGVSVNRLDDNSVIGEYCPNQSQITASTMKTVTSATALSLLGKNYRFHTKMIADGRINRKGHLEGDLVIKGGGDPTLGSGHLPEGISFIDRVIMSLKDKGVTEIKGNIVVDDTANPSPSVPGSWMLEDLGYGYGTSVHGLNFSDNTLRLNYEITKKGFNYSTVQGQSYLKVINHCNVIEEENDSISFYGPELRLDIDTDILHLYGNVKPHRGSMTIANPSPDLLLRDSLETALEAAGIKVKHYRIKASERAKATELLDYESATLGMIVNSLLVRSDNMFTECVLRAIAKNAGKQSTTENGVEVVKEFWKEKGVDVTGLFMIDGSGLSRTNKAPVSFFTQMLSIAHHELQQQGLNFYELFPVAGKDGTVKRVAAKTTASGKFAVKSGSMSHVQCYVGYYPVEKPEYTVAILINSFTCPRPELVKMVSEMLVNIDNVLAEKNVVE